MVDNAELRDLLEDVVDALANKRLMQKSRKEGFGVEITTHLIDRCKDMLKEVPEGT